MNMPMYFNLKKSVNNTYRFIWPVMAGNQSRVSSQSRRVLERCMLSTFGIRHPHRNPLGRANSRGWTQQRRVEKSNKTGNVRVTYYWGTFVQPVLQGESKSYYIFWVCTCSLIYPARNAHAPHCHLWPARHYSVFPHYLTNGTIFENMSLNIKCVF